MTGGATIPHERREALENVRAALEGARRVVLTTHVNADGDGAGCQAALASYLAGRGARVALVNPTPFPALYRYLVRDPEWILDVGAPAAADVMRDADAVVVLDTSEPNRIGKVARAIREHAVIVIDHHPPGEATIPGVVLRDPRACATGELVYDLLLLAGLEDPWPPEVVEGLYVAIVTDTGSFRFANTTPRAHLIAADLMRRGLDPEAVYRRIFANVPLRRIHLLRAALERLEVDSELPITWISIPRDIADALGVTSEDLDGIVEHARSIEGTEVALLFRELADGATKVSFRSAGDVDVNALARRFGGGGHVKAAGALIPAPLERVRAEVLEATREAVRSLERASQGR
ncbi:MAG TPA: bifunctional oligoribonuclease/PAP phosphatase NrnA [Longimicrobiales bacterium]